MGLTIQSTKKLNSGQEIPVLGLGVFQTPPGKVTREAVKFALKAGYRHIDTASVYGNEEDVGQGVRDSGVPRGEVFVTTKLWNSDHGYDSALSACDKSLRRLGLGYIDLYLIHWPVPAHDRYVETWKAFIELRDEGKVRSIGLDSHAQARVRTSSVGTAPELEFITPHSRGGRPDSGLISVCFWTVNAGALP